MQAYTENDTDTTQQVYMYTPWNMCMYVCMKVHPCVFRRMYIRLCVHVYRLTCSCMCTLLHVCIHMHMYVYTYDTDVCKCGLHGINHYFICRCVVDRGARQLRWPRDWKPEPCRATQTPAIRLGIPIWRRSERTGWCSLHCLVDRSVGRLVRWSVGRSVGRFIGFRTFEIFTPLCNSHPLSLSIENVFIIFCSS